MAAARRSKVSSTSKAAPRDAPGASNGHVSAIPKWPPLECLPYHDEQVEVNHLVPGQIVTIRNFWSRSLCKKYTQFLSTLPLVTTPGKPKKGEAVRVNDRLQVNDAQFAEQLWKETGLQALIDAATSQSDANAQAQTVPTAPMARPPIDLWGGAVLGLNENMRIYRYSPGQFFDKHYDDSNLVTHPRGPGKTTWTLLLYLTCPATGCAGGETVFYPEARGKKNPTPEPLVVGLETGMLLLHRHGNDCMLHEGREVRAGEKWVIRTDLVVRQ